MFDANGMMIHHFRISIDELVFGYGQYDYLFFFYPNKTRSLIEQAAKLSIEDYTNYNPLNYERNLMTIVVQDIEVYQSKFNHPSLNNTEFLNHIELIVAQIEETVDYYIRSKLPQNHQCQVYRPKYNGGNLVFGLRVY